MMKSKEPLTYSNINLRIIIKRILHNILVTIEFKLMLGIQDFLFRIKYLKLKL